MANSLTHSNSLSQPVDLDLEQATDSVHFFSIVGDYQAKITKVYDGDTVHAVFKIFGILYKFQIRLENIDTPEMKAQSDLEKANAVKARDFLANLILDKIVHIKCNGLDKYGRVLATIYLNEQNINEVMLNMHFGYEYHGGTKQHNYA